MKHPRGWGKGGSRTAPTCGHGIHGCRIIRHPHVVLPNRTMKIPVDGERAVREPPLHFITQYTDVGLRLFDVSGFKDLVGTCGDEALVELAAGVGVAFGEFVVARGDRVDFVVGEGDGDLVGHRGALFE